MPTPSTMLVYILLKNMWWAFDCKDLYADAQSTYVYITDQNQFKMQEQLQAIFTKQATLKCTATSDVKNSLCVCIYIFTDISLKTYWYKNYNLTLFGAHLVRNIHFLIWSLKCFNVTIDKDCMIFE